MPISSFTGDQRRRVAYRSQAGATSLRVPLETAPEGDYKSGAFVCPARIAEAAPHTNARLEFETHLRNRFDRWKGWLESRGWEYVTGSLQVTAIEPLPQETPAAEVDGELRKVWLLARWKRSTPLFVGLDDYLQIREMAKTYGVADNPLPWNDLKGEDSGIVDPMKYAQERRERLGLKRDDYLLGPLEEPR